MWGSWQHDQPLRFRLFPWGRCPNAAWRRRKLLVHLAERVFAHARPARRHLLEEERDASGPRLHEQVRRPTDLHRAASRRAEFFAPVLGRVPQVFRPAAGLAAADGPTEAVKVYLPRDVLHTPF